jgi:fatty-acid desaturase
MHSGEVKRNRLLLTDAAGSNRRGALWRRLVAAIVALAFTTILISFGFHRSAHHAADGVQPSGFSNLKLKTG